MGAGSYPAGFGPAGHDPVEIPAFITPTRPLAIEFDLEGRRFPLTEDGELAAVHPVDQAVALRIGVALGSVGAAPGLGLDVERLRYARREALQSTVDSVVAEALSDLVAAGDIALLGSPLAPSTPSGQVWFYVDYLNRRIPSKQAGRHVLVRR